MWRRVGLVILISSVAIFGALYVIYRLVDPLPPRHLVIAASTAGSGYDNVAKRYALLLARHGVELEIRHSAGAVEDLNLLREPASGVQAGSRRSASLNRPTWTPSIRWVGYSTQRFSFFTGTLSLLPCLRNSGASG
jgi:hypothetical protein